MSSIQRKLSLGLLIGLSLGHGLWAASVSETTRTPSGRPWLVMENEFLRVGISPDHDGRVASFVDKRTGLDYVWWGVPDSEGGGFAAHRLRPGASGHSGVPMKGSVQRAPDVVSVTVEGDVSPSMFVRKTYVLRDGSARLDVAMTMRNIDDKTPTPSFMPTVHNMMSAEQMESTFYIPMPEGLVIQPLDFWLSPGNNFYVAPASNWYGFVLRRAVQGVVGVFEPDTIERYFHWIGGSAGTWETWLKHRTLEPGEETTVKYSFVATLGVDDYVYADSHLVAGLPRDDRYSSLTLYSVDVAGRTDVELRYELQDGSTGTVNSTVELAPGRTASVALTGPVGHDDLKALHVAVTAGQEETQFTVGPIKYIDPTEDPLPDPELKDYPKLHDFFPYGVTYSIEASSLYPKARLRIGHFMSMWKKSYSNAIHVCNANLDMMHWFLPLSEANGIRTIPGLHNFYGGGPGPRFGPHFADEELIKRCAEPFAEHDGMLAWSIIDEPHTEFVRTFVKMRKAIEEVDAEHPVTTVTNYDGANRGFGPFVYALETDFYPSLGRTNPWPVAEWCERADAWLDGRPHWFVAQGYQDSLTAPAFRLETFAALANNAKGLIYFISSYMPRCFDPSMAMSMHDFWGNPLDFWPDFTRIGRHLCGLGPSLVATMLVRPNPIEVECSDITTGHRTRPALASGLRRDGGLKADYVVVYSNDIDAERAGTVTVPAEEDERVYDLFSMEEVDAKREGGALSFSVRFQPGDGCIYLCGAPGVFEAIRQKALRSLFEHERFVLYRDIEWAMDSDLFGWTQGGIGGGSSVAAANGKFGEALELLAEERAKLEELIGNNQALAGVRDALSRIQKKVGALDGDLCRSGIKRVLIVQHWKFVHGDGPERVILADTALGRMCEQLVFELGRRYLSLQSAYETGSYSLIVEQVELLEGELSSFETDLRGELDRFSADPGAYGG